MPSRLLWQSSSDPATSERKLKAFLTLLCHSLFKKHSCRNPKWNNRGMGKVCFSSCCDRSRDQSCSGKVSSFSYDQRSIKNRQRTLTMQRTKSSYMLHCPGFLPETPVVRSPYEPLKVCRDTFNSTKPLVNNSSDKIPAETLKSGTFCLRRSVLYFIHFRLPKWVHFPGMATVESLKWLSTDWSLCIEPAGFCCVAGSKL